MAVNTVKELILILSSLPEDMQNFKPVFPFHNQDGSWSMLPISEAKAADKELRIRDDQSKVIGFTMSKDVVVIN